MKNAEIGTADYALYRFMECLKKRDYLAAWAFTQKTWKNSPNPIAKLKELFGDKKIDTITYGKLIKHSDVFVEREIIITYEFEGRIHRKKIAANLICEEKPYRTSFDGDWGVNPLSMAF